MTDYRRVFVLLISAAAWAAPLSGLDEGPDLPPDQVAILDWSGGDAAGILEIDGRKPAPGDLLVRGSLRQKQAWLSPGKHTIRYGGTRATSVLLNPKGFDTHDLVATIEMKAGHVYVPKRERVVYGAGSYRDYFWIEDTTTGEVVAGYLPPHWREEARRSAHARAEREVAEHFEILTASAECGDAGAQYDLGLYYLAGTDPVGGRDIVNAYVWYGLAASNGHLEAAAVKDRISREIRPEQRAEAERLIAALGTKECPAGPRVPREGVTPGPPE